MMLPPKVSWSTIAAQSLGSVNVLVQPENNSFDAIAHYPHGQADEPGRDGVVRLADGDQPEPVDLRRQQPPLMSRLDIHHCDRSLLNNH